MFGEEKITEGDQKMATNAWVGAVKVILIRKNTYSINKFF